MKRLLPSYQSLYRHTLVFCVLANFITACKIKNSDLFYYVGDLKVEITISPDTLGLLLKDSLIYHSSDSTVSVIKPQKLVESNFIKQNYTSFGNLIDDSTEYDYIKLVKDPVGKKNLRSKEKSAQIIKNKFAGLVSHAGYLVRVKSSNKPMLLTDEIIVEFNPGVSKAQIDQIMKRHHLISRRKNPFVPLQITVAVTDLSPTHALKISHQLKKNPHIKFAQLNFIHLKKFYGEIPNDPYFPLQWHHQNTLSDRSISTEDADIDAELAWDFTKGSANIKIAVFDTDMDVLHEDLKNNFSYNMSEIAWNRFDDDSNGLTDDTIGWNFYNNSNYLGVTGCELTPNDCYGYHGTAVMGVIAAQSNKIGVTGICPECKIIPIRTDPFGTYDTDGYAFGYAQARGAKIFTLSWDYNGSPAPSNILSAIENATNAGILVFTAMSNSFLMDCVAGGLNSLTNTFSVSRSNSRDEYDQSGFGNCLNLLAPTASESFSNYPHFVTTDYSGDTGMSYFDESTMQNTDGDCDHFINLNYTTCFGGTSAATPLTAGVAGLILSANPAINSKQAVYLLQDCADKTEESKAKYSEKNAKSTTGTHGYGRLNAYEAVKIASTQLDIGGRNGIDIFLRDNYLDWGNTEKPSNYLFEPVRGFIPHWKSMDIKVDAPDVSLNFNPPANSIAFEDFVDEKPVANKKNMVYVRVHNRGFRTAATVNVKLYWVYAGMALPALWNNFPEDVTDDPTWHFLGNVTLKNLEYSGASVAYTMDDKSQIASFEFIAPLPDPSIRNHYCLAAIIDSPDDQLSKQMFAGIRSLDEATPGFNNITHRNYSIEAEAENSSLITQDLTLYNPYPFPVPTKVSTIISQNFKIKINGLLADSVFMLKPKEQQKFSVEMNSDEMKYPAEITLKQELILPDKKKIFGGFTFYFIKQKMPPKE